MNATLRRVAAPTLRVVLALALGGMLTWALAAAGPDQVARPDSPLLVAGFAVSFSLPIWAILDGMARARVAAKTASGDPK